jgi:hypothetical protein
MCFKELLRGERNSALRNIVWSGFLGRGLCRSRYYFISCNGRPFQLVPALFVSWIGATNLLVLSAVAIVLGTPVRGIADSRQSAHDAKFQKRINFVSKTENPTSNPANWEAYDGSPYTQERGYGWFPKPTEFLSSDGGPDGLINLPGNVVTSSRSLGRPELANFHATDSPVIFRIDLSNGWYRVSCASVAHSVLPVVDERSFKCRSHDAIFAGPSYGTPLKIRGRDLVEGSNVVEVTDKHLRIVVGDPAYGGWTWAYKGAWYRGWTTWWAKWGAHRYADNWYQKLTRVIDPAFHMLRLNSLEIHRVAAPKKRPALIFRDFFNRDDNPDINFKVAEANQWLKVRFSPTDTESIVSELYRTSLKLTGPRTGNGSVGVIQKVMSPQAGTIRYSTRVSLFTGAGSKVHSGFQEAGLLILGDPNGVTEFSSTFVGIAIDRNRTATPGFVKYRVGSGKTGYKVHKEIPDTLLPFQVREGEHEIVVDHDVKNNVLKRIRINGRDLTAMFSVNERQQRLDRGFFGIRAFIDPLESGVRLQQFYWYYRVEDIARIETLAGK